MKNKKSIDPKAVAHLENLLQKAEENPESVEANFKNIFNQTTPLKSDTFWKSYNEELFKKLNHKPGFPLGLSLFLGVAFVFALAMVGVIIYSWQTQVQVEEPMVTRQESQAPTAPVSVASVSTTASTTDQVQQILKEWSELEAKGQSVDLNQVLSKEERSDYLLAEYQMLNQATSIPNNNHPAS